MWGFLVALVTTVSSTSAELLPDFLEWVSLRPEDPFESQLVVVPNIGIAEYLDAAIRDTHGISANIEFAFTGKLRARAGIPTAMPWGVDETTWLILRALEDEPLAEHCGLAQRLRDRPLAVARHIADLFDRYGSYRPGMLRAWQRGDALDDEAGAELDPRFLWQYEIFKATQKFAENQETKARDLPNRIALFGAGPPVGAQAELVHALAKEIEVHAFLLVPGALPATLERWAAPAIAALHHFDPSATRPITRCVLPNSSLHICFGAAREFDAARDSILDGLANDKSLNARDITVLLPSLNRNASLATPILGAPLLGHNQNEQRSLPVRLADRVPAMTSETARAVDGILGLCAGRCRASEVLAVLRLPPVAAKFQISEDALDRCSDWVIDGLDVRWGLDGEHRSSKWRYDSTLDVGTWGPAIDRLLAGILIQNPTGIEAALPGLPSEPIVPFDDIAGSEFEVVGALASFVEQLRDFADLLNKPLSLSEWASTLNSLLEVFIDDNTDTRPDINALRRLVSQLEGVADQIKRPIAISEFRGYVGSNLDEQSGSARNRFDAITIGGLRARRAVPHAVTAIVGLDDDTTRSSAASGDDILIATRAHRDWEAERSEETRLAILDAILATHRVTPESKEDGATQVTITPGELIITTSGWDIVTSRDLGIPVVIVELGEAIPSLLVDGGPEVDPSAGAKYMHRRRLADDSTYDPSGNQWFEATQTRLEDAAPLGIMRAEKELLTIRDLTAPYRSPHDLYLRDGLDAALPIEVGSRDEEVDLEISNLQESILASDLLNHIEAGGEILDWRIGIQRRESLPPGLLGDAAIDALIADVLQLINVAGGILTPTERIEVSLEVGGSLIQAEMDVIGDSVLRIFSSKLQARHLIEPWITLALLTLHDPSRHWSALVAGKIEQTKNKVKNYYPHCREIKLVPGTESDVIRHALALRSAARMMPIALFPRASTATALGKAGVKGWGKPGADSLGSEFENELKNDLNRASTQWFFSGSTLDTLDETLLTSDEAGLINGAAAALAGAQTGPSISAALAYVLNLRSAFTSTARITEFKPQVEA